MHFLSGVDSPFDEPVLKGPARFEASADGAEFRPPTDSEDIEIWSGRWGREIGRVRPRRSGPARLCLFEG
jgi:hypothetical protein